MLFLSSTTTSYRCELLHSNSELCVAAQSQNSVNIVFHSILFHSSWFGWKCAEVWCRLRALEGTHRHTLSCWQWQDTQTVESVVLYYCDLFPVHCLIVQQNQVSIASYWRLCSCFSVCTVVERNRVYLVHIQVIYISKEDSLGLK